MSPIQPYTARARHANGFKFRDQSPATLLRTVRQAVRLLRKSGALWLDRICGGALLTLAASLAFYRRATV